MRKVDLNFGERNKTKNNNWEEIQVQLSEKESATSGKPDEENQEKTDGKSKLEKREPTDLRSEEDGGMMESREQGAAEKLSSLLVEVDLTNQSSYPHGVTPIQTDQDEPVPSDFNVPVDDAEGEKLITRMMQCGVSYTDAVADIEKRKKSFNQAIKMYRQKTNKKQSQREDTKSNLKRTV